MKTIQKIFGFITLTALMSASCNKPPDPIDEEPAPTTGSLTMKFEHMVGTEELVMNDSTYVNQNGDTFNVTMFKYYISNIKLFKSNGDHYDVPSGYYLVDASLPASSTFTISSIPNDNYTSIQFMIGVDSTRNVSGVQSGALDPGNNMFWSWVSGYVMLKFEGTSPQSSATQNSVLYHAGGFTGANSVLKVISPSLSGDLITINSTSTPEIHFITDVLEIFKSPTTMDFSVTNSIHMAGTMAKTFADNYEDMITVDHIH